MVFGDTIGAISTPPGKGAIGIVRISGPKSLSVADLLFNGEKVPSKVKSHTVHYGRCIRPNTGEILDEVLLLVLRSPHTYTMEDMVEFQTHGSMSLMHDILGEAFRLGVRPAEPGEFTMRAFLNGRLGLTQAEAVCDLIDAETKGAKKAALHHLGGELQSRLMELRQKLVGMYSLYEAEIDFYEEDIELVERSKSLRDLDIIMTGVKDLLDSYSVGRVIREGARIGIFGLVNVGKSSIFNSLVEKDRTIVHHEPGTTRDTVESEMNLEGIVCQFVDTAGFRAGAKTVEEEGIRRAATEIKEIDLAIFVVDASNPMPEEEGLVYKELKDGLNTQHTILTVKNKIDLLNGRMKESIPEHSGSDPMVAVSALHGWGINELRKEILRLIYTDGAPQTRGMLITSTRHYYLLSQAMKALQAIRDGIVQNAPGELMALDFREAVDHLGEITGEKINDEVLHQIFSRFCIGK